MSIGLVDSIDEIVETVSDWAVDIIKDALTALNPSGRPYGFVDQPIEEQLNDYILIKSNDQAWLAFIQNKSQEIIQRLTEAGLPEDELAAIHPFDIASRYAIAYSAYMEDELRKRS